MTNSRLLEEMVRIARQAGDAIMEVYGTDDFEVELKADESPLTRADKKSNQIIEAELRKISDYDIVSEESDGRDPKAELFWLVDPLDGTKEFIKRNGEFTVNIALVKGNRPVLGVVYAPVPDVCYCGDVEASDAYKIVNGKKIKIKAEAPKGRPKLVVSRSHGNEKTQKLLDSIGEYDVVSMGSSLKLCLVAEGAASLYPRIHPTSLWDTAASDAVVTAAGGAVKSITGNVLAYEPAKEILNPHFVVEPANNTIGWEGYLG